MPKKIVTIVGARPQFIKAATVSRIFKQSAQCTEIFVHTGQHYDANMSAIFFEDLELPRPDYDLNIGSGSHGKQTGAMLTAIEKVLLQEKPDYVLIYGDTNSTLAGALAAAKLYIAVAHVEAGLRSYNRKMPEEINRIVADQLANLLFVPTQTAVDHLKKEGVAADRIYCCGDVMYDAALYYGAKAEKTSQILQQHQLKPKNYILTTIHRPENTDNEKRLQTIIASLHELSQDFTIVMPLHPRTRAACERFGLFDRIQQRIKLIEPVGFLDMVMLEKNAHAIVTDSGGVQKEAFFYQVPCVTLRDETEWVELVELGWNRVIAPLTVGPVLRAVTAALNSAGDRAAKPYGDGHAAEFIVDCLVKT